MWIWGIVWLWIVGLLIVALAEGVVVPAEDRLGMLTALSEGVGVAVATRIFGHSEFTIQTWLTHAGMQAQSLHERLLRGLHLGHVQLDEVRTAIRQGSQIVWV